MKHHSVTRSARRDGHSTARFRTATRTTTAGAAALLICSMASAATGQDTPPDPALAARAASAASAPSGDAQQPDLIRVVVTANKREQAAIDVPASVTAISGESLTLGGATRLEDYVAEVPGMAITSPSRGQTQVTLRGIGTGSAQAMPTTAMYIDDAPIGSINAYGGGVRLTPDLDPYDLRRVEVLKGPQGTLYGAGAVGGLVRYVTEPANTAKLAGAVSVGGNAVAHGGDGSDVRAAVNIPLVTDTLGVRVSAFDRYEAGYIDDPANGHTNVNGARTQGGRVALDWELDPQWSLKAWELTQDFKAGGLGAEDVLAPDRAPLNQALDRVAYVDETQHSTLSVGNASVRGRVGDVDLVSSTTWQTDRSHSITDDTVGSTALLQAVTGVPGLGTLTDNSVTTRRVSQELRAHSTAFDVHLDYEVGLFWTKEKDRSLTIFASPFFYATGAPTGLPELGNGTIASSYDEQSIFGNVTWSASPRLDLLAGVRESHDNQHFDLDYLPSALSPVAVNLLQQVSHDKATWMTGANFKIHPDTSLYARVATGYRPGGPSALPPGVIADGKTAFEPDTLTSYEAGFKSAFLGGKASIETAVFHTDWKNIQLMALAPANPPVTFIGLNYGTNGGSARSNGAEASLLAFPSDRLTLRANVAYTDSRLSSAAPAVNGVSGDAMPYVPRWTSSLGGEYRFPLGSAKAWVGGSVNTIGKRSSDYSENHPLALPGYTTLGLDAGMDWHGVRVSLYAKNLTDSRGINYAAASGAPVTPANPYGNPYAASVIAPRTLGADLTWFF